MKLRWVLAALTLLACSLPAQTASTLGAKIRDLSLDPNACYRIRDLSFQKGDASFYLTDGYLIFSKPIEDRVILAVFHATETIDDAEILLRPPDRGERASLAAFSGAPNLNEHFRSAVFLFTDGTGEELLKDLKSSPVTKPAPDMATLLESRFAGVGRNLARSFDVRLVHDLLSRHSAHGMFYAGIASARLGNIDLLYDPTALEPITLGQVSTKTGATTFDVWTSFQTRARAQSGEGPVLDGSISNYRIDATVEPSLALSAVTRLTWTPARPLSGSLAFEIAPEMEVTAAKFDGVDVEIYREPSLREGLIGGRRNEPFLIALPGTLEPGKPHEIEFHHRGRVITDAGNNVYFVGARTNWYPIRGLAYANYDLTFKVPKALTLVATGEEISDREEGEWRVVRHRTTSPIRLAGFNLGVYDHVSINRGGLHVEVFANRQAETALQRPTPPLVIAPPPWNGRGALQRPPEVLAMPVQPPPDPKARLAALAGEVSSSMEWMTQQFGPPPLKTLTVSPIPGFFGQGFPGLLYLSTLSFLNERDRPRIAQNEALQTFYTEILYAHEAAHQWWGNLVVAATYRDDWVQEALANYSALLILERRKGSKALENVLAEYRANLLKQREDGKAVESAGPITWGVRLRTGTSPDPWRVITYDKGSWIMHMLRRRMGDAQFLKMLGEFRRRYEYKTFTTEQFRAHAAAFMPPSDPDRSLENFFDNWVYGTGIPSLSMQHNLKGAGPKRVLTVTLSQSGVSNEFGIDVPVEVRLPGQKEPLVKWLRTSSEPVSFTVRVGAAQPRVELAPGLGVLAVRK